MSWGVEDMLGNVLETWWTSMKLGLILLTSIVVFGCSKELLNPTNKSQTVLPVSSHLLLCLQLWECGQKPPACLCAPLALAARLSSDPGQFGGYCVASRLKPANPTTVLL